MNRKTFKLFLDIKYLFESQILINKSLLDRIFALEDRIFALEDRVAELEKILHDKNLKNE